MMRRRALLAALSLTAALAMSACSAAPGSQAPTSSGDTLGSVVLPPPKGEVIGTGTVMDHAGEVTLCMGAIAESYPPQCSGTPLDGWSWEGVDGSEISGDIRWGTYAVYAMYDGERLTTTDAPIMLALYDPISPADPAHGKEGATSSNRLTEIHDDLSARLGRDALGIGTDRGYVWLSVIWDDGTLQRAANTEFGDDVVFVTSALRETGR